MILSSRSRVMTLLSRRKALVRMMLTRVATRTVRMWRWILRRRRRT